MDDNISSFTNFVQDEAYAYIDNSLEISSFDLLVRVPNADDVTSDLLVAEDVRSDLLVAENVRSGLLGAEGIDTGSSMLDPVMGIINHDDPSLSMDEYKYIAPVPPIFQQQPPAYPQFPPSEVRELCTIDYAGPLNFEVFIDPNPMKTPWEYLPPLNKIYIDMKTKFPVNFSVTPTNEQQQLFIRVVPTFEQERDFQDLVHRCICHEQEQDISNYGIPKHVIQHIMRCDNSNARYFGDRHLQQRLNIVIPLESPHAGADSVKEYFSFVCKNSCVLGMNRKPIQVIFTLEDQHASILGRRVLRVRICSCPKRDKEKDERKLHNQDDSPPPRGKKRKMDNSKKTPPPAVAESPDVRVFPLSLQVVGEENFKFLIKQCQLLMTNEILQLEGKTEEQAPFRKCINDAKELLTCLTPQNGND